MRKKRSAQLPKLALMATLVTCQAQAALVNPNQEEWLWRDVTPVNLANSANQTTEPASSHHSDGDGNNAMFWYWLGHTIGNSGSGGNYNTPSSPTSPSSYSSNRPAPAIGSNVSGYHSGSSHPNNQTTSPPSKGYSTGGMGSTGGRSGASSSSGG